MLKQLRINNIILIDHADITFEKGLNVLSGETGSGKSAIMEALNLVLGERADTGLIRKGCDKGVVEALFEVDQIPEVVSLLEQGGIEHVANEDLVIRREIHSNGKSRAFINNQMAQLTFLKNLGNNMIDIIGQHANQRLRTVENHREIIDIAGDHSPRLKTFQSAWEKENKLRKELDQLSSSEAQRLRDIEICKMELEELHETQIKEGEDEELFEEYTLLTNSEELMGNVTEINQVLSGDKNSILTQLNRLKLVFEKLVAIVPSFSDNFKAFNDAHLELQEIAYSTRAYQGTLEFNPARAEEINNRLGLINRLKRKYGKTVSEIHAYQASLEERLESLENADQQIEEMQGQLAVAEKSTNEIAARLTEERKVTAKKLEKAIITKLRAFNMPKVEFHVQIAPQKRNHSADDRIEFFLAPNLGENLIPVRESASGGELSRLMLALQAVLAGKEKKPTLVFDEIDANIGGETASVIGEQLNKIGEKHQVLCITHFPQVASQAKHHLQISKREIEGRTITCIKILDEQDRQKELSRMLGGDKMKDTPRSVVTSTPT